MDSKKIGSLLHPIRMQILKTLAKRRELTTREFSAEMPDVPQASLYRHLRAMLEDGILEVSEQRRVRGAVERSYRIKADPVEELAGRLGRLTKGELLELFTSFVIAELYDFAEYLGEDDYPVEKDRVGFSSSALYLDDEELRDFIAALRGLVKDRYENEARVGRRLHKFSFSMIPTRPVEREA